MDCHCNLNHNLCVNSKCATDTSCQRITTVSSDGRIVTDDMLCSENGSHSILSICDTVQRVSNMIAVRYCCVDPYCNANNTYLFEVIRSKLGML